MCPRDKAEAGVQVYGHAAWGSFNNTEVAVVVQGWA